MGSEVGFTPAELAELNGSAPTTASMGSDSGFTPEEQAELAGSSVLEQAPAHAGDAPQFTPEEQAELDQGIALDNVRYSPERTFKQEFGAGVARGTDQLQGSLYGLGALVGEATGIDAIKNWGLDGYHRNQGEAADNQATVQGFSEMEFGKDFFKWAVGELGNAAPSLAAAAGSGGFGAIAAKKLGDYVAKNAIKDLVAKGINKDLAKRFITKQMKDPKAHGLMFRAVTSPKAGALAGVYGASAAPQTGEVYTEIHDAGIEAPGTAVVAGAIGGLLDAAPQVHLFKQLMPGVGRDVAQGWVKRTAKLLGTQSVLEGSTEGAQELIAITAHAMEDPNFEIDSPENYERVMNAAAAGALVGAVSGGISGPFSGRNKHTPHSTEDEKRDKETEDAILDELSSSMAKDVQNEGDTLDMDIEPESDSATLGDIDSVRDELTKARETLAAQDAAEEQQTDDETQTEDSYSGINEVEPDVFTHMAKGNQPWARSSFYEDGISDSLNKKLKELQDNAEALGTGSTFEVVPEGDGFIIREHTEDSVVVQAQDPKSGDGSETKVPRHVYVEQATTQAIKEAKEQKPDPRKTSPKQMEAYENANPVFKTAEGRRVRINAMLLTLAGLRLASKNAPQKDTPYKYLRAFLLASSELAAKQNPLTPLVRGFPGNMVVFRDKHGKYTVDDLERENWTPRELAEFEGRVADAKLHAMREQRNLEMGHDVQGVYTDEKTGMQVNLADKTQQDLTGSTEGLRERETVETVVKKGADGKPVYRTEKAPVGKSIRGKVEPLEDEKHTDSAAQQDDSVMRRIYKRDENGNPVWSKNPVTHDEAHADPITGERETFAEVLDEDRQEYETVREKGGNRMLKEGRTEKTGQPVGANMRSNRKRKPPRDTAWITTNKQSKTVTARDGAFIKRLANTLGLTVSVRIVDEDGLQALGPKYKEWHARLVANKVLGSVNFEGHSAIIFISKQHRAQDPVTRFRILAHEFGHIIVRAEYFDLSKTTKGTKIRDALKKDYAKWVADGKASMNEAANMEEWLANRFVGWAIGREDMYTANNEVVPFFQRIKAKLRKVFNKIKARYPVPLSFHAFMDQIVMQAEQGGSIRVAEAGKSETLNMDLPSWADYDRAKEILGMSKKKLLGAMDSIGNTFIRSVNMRMRNFKDAEGKPIQAAIQMINLFHREPGQVLRGALRPVQQVPVRDKKGNIRYYKDGRMMTRTAPIEFGYLEEVQRVSSPFIKRLDQIAHSIDRQFSHLKGDLKKEAIAAEEYRILRLLQDETLTDAELKNESLEAYRIRVMLRDIHKYLKQHIPNLGFLPNYFPRVYDTEYLGEHREEFVDMLTDSWVKMWEKRHKKEVPTKEKNAMEKRANEVADGILKEMGAESMIDDGVHMEHAQPSFGFDHERGITGIPAADLTPFLSKDLAGVMATYIRQSAKRAEHDRRFGRFTGRMLKKKDHKGNEIEFPEWDPMAEYKRLVGEATASMSPHQITQFNADLKALRGQMGADLDPRLRSMYSGMMLFQNFRTLAFPLFSSFPDLAGIFIRSKDFSTAWDALKDNFKDIIEASKSNPTFNHGRFADGRANTIHNLAAAVGAVTEKLNHIALQEQYGSSYQTKWAQKANDWLFKWNGLQVYTKFTRVMAVAMGREFIIDHAMAAKEGNAQSQRYLDELGLTADDVAQWLSEGEQAWGMEDTVDNKNAELIAQALNRFVNQSIMRPDSSIRPAWGSDPRFMLIFHLKSFMYTMHEQILKGIVAETKARGRENAALLRQYAPVIMAIGLMLPLAALGLELRNWLQYKLWGKDPYFKSTDVFELVQRTGGLGIFQLGVDIFEAPMHGRSSMLAPLGPTVSWGDMLFSKGVPYTLNRSIPLYGQMPGLRAQMKELLE